MTMKVLGRDPRLSDGPEGTNGWVRITAELYLDMLEKAFPERDDIEVRLSEPDPLTGEVEVTTAYMVDKRG